MVGSISTLGIGSGLKLQDILDQLRELDQQVIERKKIKVTDTKVQLDEFTVVNNKLLTMKSKAVTLSLSSTFLSRSATSSSESVLTATAVEGASAQSTPLTITSLATKNSFESSSGFTAKSTSIYVPTSQESTSGVADPAAGTVAATGETMTITFGSGATSKNIVVTAASDLTMNQLVDEINNHADNQGGPGANGRYVTAETYVSGGNTYLRVKSDTVNAKGEANRVTIGENLAALSFSAPDAVFSYKLGSGQTISVSVAADTSLEGLVNLINDDSNNPGMTASLINKGDGSTPYRMVLRADAVGEDNRITFGSSLADIPMTEKQGALGATLNAVIEMDGITYERKSNTVTDLLTGVTLNLLGEGSSTVTVADDTQKTVDLINGLVDAYNDAVQEVNAKSAYDKETRTFGTLFRTTLRGLPSSLESLMTSVVKADSGGNITSLFDLGLEFNRDGTITIDEDVLKTAVTDHASGVQDFFIGNDEKDITGFADLIIERMRVLTGAGGQVEAEKSAADAKIKDLESHITDEVARLDKKYELMAKQFSQLDRYMSQMTSISDYLTGQFESLSGNGSGSSN